MWLSVFGILLYIKLYKKHAKEYKGVFIEDTIILNGQLDLWILDKP